MAKGRAGIRKANVTAPLLRGSTGGKGQTARAGRGGGEAPGFGKGSPNTPRPGARGRGSVFAGSNTRTSFGGRS
jgi:hypothetical protein